MEFSSALEAGGVRCGPAWHPSTSQPTVFERRCASSHRSRVFLCTNGPLFHKNGAFFRSCSTSSAPLFPSSSGALRPRREPLFRAQAQETEEEVSEEGFSKAEDAPKLEAEGQERPLSDEEEFGIDAQGNLTDSLPKEFLELMKDDGPTPNYLLAGFGLVVAFLARKSILRELQNWGRIAVGSGRVARDAVVLLFAQLVVWGGDPLAKVIYFVAAVFLTINNAFRFIADVVSPLPVLYSVLLASIVLLVGESASETYSSKEKEFPSRTVLDIAGFLGLAGLVGLLPVEIVLIGLAAITTLLLFARKVNPVAGLTPAAAVFSAISEPIIRYSVFFSFVGFGVYRYWSLGYMSSGAVRQERTAEYPRLLIGLLYLVAISVAARSFFFVVDWVSVFIAVFKAA